MIYEPSLQKILLLDVEKEIGHLFSNHPAASGKSLAITPARPGQTVHSDYSLLMRILTNMVTNAFEASKEGETVRYWVAQQGKSNVFFVWNNQAIALNIQPRIFQRHFSTKKRRRARDRHLLHETLCRTFF